MENITIPQIFRDRCPEWTLRLETESPMELQEGKGGPDGIFASKLYMGRFNSCIVGEAYGFSSCYLTEQRCNECYKMSEHFDLAIRVEMSGDLKLSLDKRELKPGDLQKLIYEFSEHLEAVHNPKEQQEIIIPEKYLVKPQEIKCLN